MQRRNCEKSFPIAQVTVLAKASVFSRLNAFKTWPQGPGVYLKPAFNRGPAFINEVKFSSFLG